MKLSRRAYIKGLSAVCASVLAAATLTACGSDGGGADSQASGSKYFGYAVDSALNTTNSASAEGSSANTEALTSRIYPSAFVPGPSGQLIPNTDLVRAQELPGGNRRVVYTIADNAVFSDGTPITCVDFMLYVAAGHNPDLFESNLPLTNSIEQIRCQPGGKQFTLIFKEGEGERWRYLFGPGSVLPAHAIAKKAGLSDADMFRAVDTYDPAVLEPVARVWNSGFSLKNFDPELQVSAGPFSVDHVGEDGSIVLKRNDFYYGDPAGLDKLTIWPAGSDLAGLSHDGNLRVADLRSESAGWVNRDDPKNPYDLQPVEGDLTDMLRLGSSGVFRDAESRAAFAACVDQAGVAKASSEVTGVEVSPVHVHSLPHADPLVSELQAIDDAHSRVDIPAAEKIKGATVRIGYPGPDKRRSAMVEAIKRSCEPAGISVVDASAEAGSVADLTSPRKDAQREEASWNPEVAQPGPTVDAVLVTVDPMAEFDAPNPRIQVLDKIRGTEERLWADSSSIPLSAQPRTFVVDRDVANIAIFTGLAGIGWNMDRWRLAGKDSGKRQVATATVEKPS